MYELDYIGATADHRRSLRTQMHGLRDWQVSFLCVEDCNLANNHRDANT
jgi:hypothetical protein